LELEHDKIEKYLGGIWALMIVALLAGLYLHQATAAAWQMWWAVWLCEIFTYVLYALFFTLKTPSTALAVAIGSIVWYISQTSTTASGWPAQNLTYILTAIASGFLVYYAWSHREDTNIPYVSKSDVNAFGAVALIVMMVFAVSKMFGWIPWSYDVAAFTSAVCWSFGQLLISLGCLLFFVKLKEYRSTPLYIAVLGLLIAMYAALVYGIALTLL
jgi:hypothetical protein